MKDITSRIAVKLLNLTMLEAIRRFKNYTTKKQRSKAFRDLSSTKTHIEILVANILDKHLSHINMKLIRKTTKQVNRICSSILT